MHREVIYHAKKPASCSAEFHFVLSCIRTQRHICDCELMNFTYSTHQISGLPSALNTWQDELLQMEFCLPLCQVQVQQKNMATPTNTMAVITPSSNESTNQGINQSLNQSNNKLV